jgi:hypothetical protein
MHRWLIAAGLLAVAACSIQRAMVASQAQHDMVGMSRAQILACMGPPAQRQADSDIEVWAYPSGGRTDSFGVAQTSGSATGVYNGNAYSGTYVGSGSTTTFGNAFSVNRYCVVDVVFAGDRVSTVNYLGRTGGLITQGEECAYAVRSCSGQGAAPSASAAAAPQPAAPQVASTPAAGQFPNLEAVAQAGLAGTADIYPDEVRGKLVECAAHAIVADIPQSDQERMLAAVNSRSIGPDEDALFRKWFGMSFAHGPIKEPKPGDGSTSAGGVLHYADGTPVPPSDPANLARVRANASRYCPELVDRYSRFFD